MTRRPWAQAVYQRRASTEEALQVLADFALECGCEVHRSRHYGWRGTAALGSVSIGGRPDAVVKAMEYGKRLDLWSWSYAAWDPGDCGGCISHELPSSVDPCGSCSRLWGQNEGEHSETSDHWEPEIHF